MKVQLTKESKRIVTLEEMPAVRQIIASLKDDTDLTEQAESAVRAITKTNGVRILEASASICKNSRVWNYYTDESGHLDVWIEFSALLDNGFGGFIMGGACLSDIWSLCGDSRDAEAVSHMFVRKFREVR